jgi:hypothetical protein
VVTVLATVAGVAAVLLTTTSAALTAKITNSANNAGTRAFFTCRNALTSLPGSTYLAWAMGTSGSSETDIANTTSPRTGSYNPTVTATVSDTGGLNTSIGCLRDSPARSVNFLGNRCLYIGATTAAVSPTTFSVEAWFWSSTTGVNGKIIGLGNSQSNSSDGTYDRHIYLDKDGRAVFGIYSGGQNIVASTASYNDSKWHHVVGTYSASTRMNLYVDGVLVAGPTALSGTINTDAGWWKVGCGTLSTWADAAGTALTKPAYFTGRIQYAAVYTVVLTADQVKSHYLAGVN